MLLPVYAVHTVVVLNPANVLVASTLAITRFDAEPTTAAVPTAASYPTNVRYCLSPESVNAPSEVAVPLCVRIRLAPLTAVGADNGVPTTLPFLANSTKFT